MANPRDAGYAAYVANPDPDLREVPGVGILPRVTAVLKMLSAPALDTWRVNTERELVISAVKRASSHVDLQPGAGWLSRFWSALKDVRAEARALPTAASLGTAAHTWIAWRSAQLLGQDAGLEPTVPDAVRPAVDAWERWAVDVRFSPLLVESSIHCAEPSCGYCGTADSVAEVEGRTVLCDWKRSSRVYEGYRLQLGAYAHALKATEGLVVDAGLVVRLPQESGDVEVCELPPAELSESFDVFRGLLAAWRWRRALDEKASEAMVTVRRRSLPFATNYALQGGIA